MNSGAVRVGVGTRFFSDGEIVEITEIHPSAAGIEAVLKRTRTQHVLRMSVRELLAGDRARVLPVEAGPSANDPFDTPGVVLANLSESERGAVLERAGHLREVLTGYRSGHPETAIVGEPREQYDPQTALMRRYEAKAEELGIGLRTLRRWVNDFRQSGEAGLVESAPSASPTGRIDDQWVETAVEVTVEHSDQSRPSRTMVIDRTKSFSGVKFVDPIKALIAAGYDYKVDAVRGIAGSRLGAGAALPPLLLDDDGP